MTKFYAANGQFWLDDKPLLIQAGEFHYFRTPREEWRQRLGLLKAAGFNAVAAYIPWLWHQVEEDVSDFDGHSHPMRDLQGFLDLAAEIDLFILSRPGPYINAETINEGIPPWVFQKYPQVTFLSNDGKPQNIVSYQHPDFLACVRKWYKAVYQVLAPRQITRGGRIVMVQLDNEMGMMEWVRNILDANPDTVARFAAYLRAAYGADLPARYPPGDLQEFLASEILHPSPAHGAQIVEDYRQFYRGYLRQYTAFLWDEARANGLEVPPVINIHGFANGGKTFPIGISQLIEVMRMDGMLSATDVYPGHIGEGNIHQLLLVNEITKALHNPQQPLFSIEFQAGGNQDFSGGQSSMNDLHARLCISSGMRAINHYLFCDGENHPVLSPTIRHDWGHPVRKDGTLRKHYFRYGKLSSVLSAYGTDLTLSRPDTVTTIGFQLDDFMTEVNNPFSRPAADIITHQRDDVLFDFIARGLTLTHRNFNAIELETGTLDAARTPTLWVMMDKRCSAAAQQKLVEYVRQGGRLILVGRMCEEDSAHKPCTILKDVLGIRSIQSDAPFTDTYIRAFHYVDIPASFVETYTGDFDKVFASRTPNETVGFIKTLGLGKVLVFGAAMTANTLDDVDVVNQIALEMDCPSPFQLSDWADVRLSRGEKGSFLFAANYQDDPLETTVAYHGADLFGGHLVFLPARRGLILPVEWQMRPDVTLHYVTSEINGVYEDGSTLLLTTAQPEFFAELTLSGYTCAGAETLRHDGAASRIHLHGTTGQIILHRIG